MSQQTEETLGDSIQAIVARTMPAGVDCEDLVDELSTELAVWLAEAYNEGLSDGRRPYGSVLIPIAP